MPLERQTIAIPILKGINVTKDARLVDPPELLEATNSRFTGKGSSKRRGHTQVTVHSQKSFPAGSAVTDSQWLYGWGFQLANARSTGDTTLGGTSEHPSAGRLYGTAQRDQETILWNGHSLYSYPPSQTPLPGGPFAEITGAVMPSCHVTPLAKIQTSQSQPDVGDNGVIRVVAWLDTPNTAVRYTIYDSVSGAVIVSNLLLTGVTTPWQVRVVPLGVYVHMLVSDQSGNTLQVYSISQSTPLIFTQRSYGACVKYFDVWKIDESVAVIAKTNNNTKVDITFLSQNGNIGPDSPFQLTLVNNISQVALAVHPVNNHIGIIWNNSIGETRMQVWSRSGISQSTVILLQNTYTADRITIAPKYLYGTDGTPLWDIYFENSISSPYTYVVKQRASNVGIIGSQIVNGAGMLLASRAFRVGDRTFVWAAHTSTLQTTWFLLDEGLLPVGKINWGTAAPIPHAQSFTASVNWMSDPTVTQTPVNKNQVLFHLALGYTVRQPTTAATIGVYTEPSVEVVTLNFLPPFRTAQAGRSTYIAGAQVWSYDGSEVVEQGFHIGPEVPAPVQSNGGSLTALGTYQYRIDLCYKNAQGEEVRSLSILTPPVTLTGTNQTLTLTIPTCITRRTNSYFLIFRNAMANGIALTNFWLLNSRNPTSAQFKPNTPIGAQFITFVDAGTLFSDAAIQSNELHPANTGETYLHPFSAYACEVIASGRDRVWIGGGELLPGQVSPSRLFNPGEAPSFNSYLNIQVDRSAEPFTAIGFVGEVVLFFRKNAAHILDSDGPDNITNGSWAPARLALSDLGAIGQESLALIPAGLLFQSPAGIRLIGPSGQLSPIGYNVDAITKGLGISATVVVTQDQEVRWYTPTKTIVYNYLYTNWSTWTVTAQGAVRDFTTGLVNLAQANGTMFIETDGVWVDGDRPYTHRIRLPWLHAGSIGDFQRITAMSGIGKWSPTDPPGNHTVRVELYYDNREFYEEVFQWTFPDTTVNDVDKWGNNNWGDGVWGDTASYTNSPTGANIGPGAVRDLNWDWKRKPNRQKCGQFSVAVEDYATPGPGFTFQALCLKLAMKPGLSRIPFSTPGTSDTLR